MKYVLLVALAGIWFYAGWLVHKPTAVPISAVPLTSSQLTADIRSGALTVQK